MKQKLIILLIVIAAYAVAIAGLVDTEDILYQRLDDIDMPEDSIKLVMALPRTMITDWDGAISCVTYLEVAPAVAAAAIVVVNDACIEKKILFNYNNLRRGK